VTKIREESSPNRHGLLFKIDLPEIKDGVRPIRRMMSAFEQRREIPNRAIQYLLVSLVPISGHLVAS
jgi:splicing factor 3A subunit 2